MALSAWKTKARQLKQELRVLYLACHDPRVPWYARWLAVGVVAYVLSPIDLIPDFIPVLGYLDDFILAPLGIALALRMIPPEVMAECRARAQAEIDAKKPINWVAGAVIIAIWLAIGAWLVIVALRLLKHR